MPRARMVDGLVFYVQFCTPWASADVVYPVACPGGFCPGLGNTYYLPGPWNPEGHPFALKRKLGECASSRVSPVSTRTMKVANSMKELVEEKNSDFSLSGSFKTAALTVKGSVATLTSESSDLTTTFHSAHLDVTYISEKITLDRSVECFNDESDFDADFLGSFKSLEDINPEKVFEASSWAPYVNFLKDQGSHIMTEQSIGSRFQQWESSTSSTKDIAHTLQVKACASVEGTYGPGGWSVGSCAAYNSSEKSHAMQTSTYANRQILGGSSAARIALLTRFGNDTLNNFIDSAPNGTHPVSYGFLPVWETLIELYQRRCSQAGATSDDCKYMQKAYNLQAAYEGWLAVGCPKLETTNGHIYQQMTITDPSSAIKTYQCDAAKTGCYSNDDCHLGGAGSVCYCYGASCIDSGDTIAGTSSTRDKVRGDKSGSYRDGVNNACHYHFIAHCDCHYDWSGGLPARQLWTQDASVSQLTSIVSV